MAAESLFEYGRDFPSDTGKYSKSKLNEFELLKRAVDRLVDANATEIKLDKYMLSHLVVDLGQLSIAPYEGRMSEGSLILANSKEVTPLLPFAEPVPIDEYEYRASRKAIETSTYDNPMLIDGGKLRGILSRESFLETGIPHSEIRFLGRNWWRWTFGDRILFEMRDGTPGMKQDPIDEEALEIKLSNWQTISDTGIKRIWNVVKAVMHSGHGAGVIVSSEAEAEAARLGTESIRTEVIELPGNLAAQLSRMDGAILLDLEGYVHAFGIIVDGPACTDGNPGRGARYNCSLRYVRSREGKAFVFVISTDGTVDPLGP